MLGKGRGRWAVSQKPKLIQEKIQQKSIQSTLSKTDTFGFMIRFWETYLFTVHLPLSEANINTYFSLKAKCWLRRGGGGHFPPLGLPVSVCVREMSVLQSQIKGVKKGGDQL